MSLVLLAFGGILISLAWTADINAKTLLLRWLAAFWFATAALAIWNARRRPTRLFRHPVPMLNVLIAAMCLAAST